jgi:hypothetical protein
MSHIIVCKYCNHKLELDNRFCDNCGNKIIESSSPNDVMSDDQVIGKIIEIIDENQRISYKNIIKIAKKTDFADRIIARLENKGFFSIIRENDQFFLQKIPQGESTKKVFKLDSTKLNNLENFVKMGPIHVDNIPGLMGISDDESKELVNYLVKEKHNLYQILINGKSSFLSLKEN